MKHILQHMLKQHVKHPARHSFGMQCSNNMWNASNFKELQTLSTTDLFNTKLWVYKRLWVSYGVSLWIWMSRQPLWVTSGLLMGNFSLTCQLTSHLWRTGVPWWHQYGPSAQRSSRTPHTHTRSLHSWWVIIVASAWAYDYYEFQSKYIAQQLNSK